VLYEDSAALLGLLVAFGGVFSGHYFANPYFDGTASVIIGVILAIVAVLLAYKSKGLLVGEEANQQLLASIRELATAAPSARTVAARAAAVARVASYCSREAKLFMTNTA
jgi:divalent metal cation (Fe/Co/Zn/Cd) transporter